MSEVHIPATQRQQRLIEARLSIKRAAQHIERYPHATATPVVKDLKASLAALVVELEAS